MGKQRRRRSSFKPGKRGVDFRIGLDAGLVVFQQHGVCAVLGAGEK